MSFVINGNTYRNIQEQVQKNKDDIAQLEIDIGTHIYSSDGEQIEEAYLLQDVIDDEDAFVSSAAVYSVKSALQEEIDEINEKIPSDASDSNQLADKAFVNSSISTATATFRGTYNVVDDLGLTVSATTAQVAAALDAYGLTQELNDYVFVSYPDQIESGQYTKFERYKFDGSNWTYEYTLNNSSFTQVQWNAINSGITSALVQQISDNADDIADIQNDITTLQNDVATNANDIANIKDGTSIDSFADVESELSGKQDKIVYSSRTETFTSSTSAAYTGVSVTLPKGYINILWIAPNSPNGLNYWCALYSSSSTYNAVLTQSSYSSNTVWDYSRSAGFPFISDNRSSAATYYIWARYSNQSSNTITIRLLSIPM